MHSKLALKLGKYILTERRKQEIKQKTLAAKIGISAQFLGRIEKGEVFMPEKHLIKCIKILSLKEKKMTQIYKSSTLEKVRDLFSRIKR